MRGYYSARCLGASVLGAVEPGEGHATPFGVEGPFMAVAPPLVRATNSGCDASYPIQFAVGVMSILGYRTRVAALLGAAFLVGLIIIGATRYPPFLLGILIPVIGLDGGRYISVDRVQLGDAYRPRFGLPIPQVAVVPLLVLTAVNAVAAIGTAFVSGIEPGAYVESMPAMTTAMVAIFSGLFAFVGWLQLRPTMSVTPDEGVALLEAV